MLIIGCDFHSRFQQIVRLDDATGEVEKRRLEHGNGEAQTFHASLVEPALVGIESTGYTVWFAELMSELGTSWWWATPRRVVPPRRASRNTTGATPGT